METVLITGGAGFIGSHLAEELLSAGYHVRVLDNLTPQVHPNREWPDYLNAEVERYLGDVRDPQAITAALDGADGVFHYAAAVGVGQSMYEIGHYTSVNNFGTATLLEVLSQRPVKKLVVASSMSLYGEGLYRDGNGRVTSAHRDRAQIADRQWEPCGHNGEPLVPIPTPETKAPDLASVYALSKFDQERLCLMVAGAQGIPATALRFFNVYGPYQALSNPYTGVLAIFAARYLNGRPPLIYEDGEQRRDFVNVRDVARASRLAYETSGTDGQTFNIGSGRARTIREIAEDLGRVLDRQDLTPEITGRYRIGDIRHCFADISRAREILGYEPWVPFETGLAELADWLLDAQAEDRIEQASAELDQRGLTV